MISPRSIRELLPKGESPEDWPRWVKAFAFLGFLFLAPLSIRAALPSPTAPGINWRALAFSIIGVFVWWLTIGGMILAL